MKDTLKGNSRFLLLLVAAFLFTGSSAMPEMMGFAPLHCNMDAGIDSQACLDDAVNFSSIFSAEESRQLTIPCGACVVMDYTDGSTITIPGGLNVLGRLHFPPSANVVLRTTAVFVQGSWSMDIPDAGNTVKVSLYGSGEKQLYPHTHSCDNADISNVYGYECASNPEPIGRKPFVVAGGKLDIRAIDESCSSWTKLADATMDSFTTDLAFASCLRQGDELLITSDQMSRTAHKTFTVDSVDTSTGEILFQEAIPRIFPSLAGPGEPDFALEVALLRRDVIFEAEPDPEEDWIGGHSIIYHTPHVVQTIQGVKFDNFGQEGVLGRYPIHFHMSGSSPSLVSKNVIVNSNQRCVFIHDTNEVTIDDNVAFDTKGHCYATETGSEVNNIFRHNLGAYTKKLTRSNGQSDSPGGHSEGTSTFWIRNMKNTFIGNVAAGNVDTGFWLEMKDMYSNQLNDESFKDNTAHSCFRGLLTYKKGWKPKQPGVMVGFKAYWNEEGFKFHITGNLTFKNALLADNRIGMRYGAWNDGVKFEDSMFLGLSDSRKERFNKDCPPSNGHGIRASFNSHPKRPPLSLENVVFKNFLCGTESIQVYHDTRMEDDMGNPIKTKNVSIVTSEYKNRPRLNGCNYKSKNWHMEDNDATLGPDNKGQGFLIRNNARMKAFLPEGSCETPWYDGSTDSDGNTCTAFCENVCLRLVHLKPTGSVTMDGTGKLKLTDLATGKFFTYTLNEYGKAIIVLPPGQYSGDFLDETGSSVTIDEVEILTYEEPQCSNFVTENDFSFVNTPAPSASPSTSPPSASPSDAPTVHYDMTYQPAGENVKCPWDSTRLFKYNTGSIDECLEWCFGQPGCNFFTVSESRQLCLGCSLENASYLSSDSDFDAYEMTTIKAPADFGYELWDGIKGINKKCPWKSPTNDRIGKYTTSTRKECYHLCKNNDQCGWFSWGEEHADDKDRHLCLLCKSDANFAGDTGIFSYELVA